MAWRAGQLPSSDWRRGPRPRRSSARAEDGGEPDGDRNAVALTALTPHESCAMTGIPRVERQSAPRQSASLGLQRQRAATTGTNRKASRASQLISALAAEQGPYIGRPKTCFSPISRPASSTTVDGCDGVSPCTCFPAKQGACAVPCSALVARLTARLAADLLLAKRRSRRTLLRTGPDRRGLARAELNPDDRYVAFAIARGSPPGVRKESPGRGRADARTWP